MVYHQTVVCLRIVVAHQLGKAGLVRVDRILVDDLDQTAVAHGGRMVVPGRGVALDAGRGVALDACHDVVLDVYRGVVPNRYRTVHACGDQTGLHDPIHLGYVGHDGLCDHFHDPKAFLHSATVHPRDPNVPLHYPSSHWVVLPRVCPLVSIGYQDHLASKDRVVHLAHGMEVVPEIAAHRGKEVDLVVQMVAGMVGLLDHHDSGRLDHHEMEVHLGMGVLLRDPYWAHQTVRDLVLLDHSAGHSDLPDRLGQGVDLETQTRLDLGRPECSHHAAAHLIQESLLHFLHLVGQLLRLGYHPEVDQLRQGHLRKVVHPWVVDP